jgi:hypothetical protein
MDHIRAIYEPIYGLIGYVLLFPRSVYSVCPRAQASGVTTQTSALTPATAKASALECRSRGMQPASSSAPGNITMAIALPAVLADVVEHQIDPAIAAEPVLPGAGADDVALDAELAFNLAAAEHPEALALVVGANAGAGETPAAEADPQPAPQLSERAKRAKRAFGALSMSHQSLSKTMMAHVMTMMAQAQTSSSSAPPMQIEDGLAEVAEEPDDTIAVMQPDDTVSEPE